MLLAKKNKLKNDLLSRFQKKKNILLISSSFAIFFLISFIPIDIGKKSKRFNNIQPTIIKLISKINESFGFISKEMYDYGGSIFNIGQNFANSLFIREDDIKLNLKLKNLNKLESIRKNALDVGILTRTNGDLVKGSINYKGLKYPVRLRLKGDWTDHLIGEKWSFRVKTTSNETFLGMNEFSLQHPRTRNYINEYVFHQILKYEKLPYLRYDFIPFSINGKYLGIYALEEHFSKLLLENSGFREGPIIKFSDFDKRAWYKQMAEVDFKPTFSGITERNSDIDTFNSKKFKNDENYITQYLTGVALLDKFTKKELITSQVFDIELTAKYFAISDLLQATGNTWYDMRFYYDPISARIIPIGYDSAYPIISEKRTLSSDTNILNIFDDPIFFKEYIKNLEKFSDPNYLESFLKNIRKDLNYQLRKINKSYPYVSFLKNELVKNQNYIRRRLKPIKPIGIDLTRSSKSDKKLKLHLYNKIYLPINIKSIVWNNNIFYPKKSKDNYLPQANRFKRVKGKEILFLYDEKQNINNEKSINTMTINYNINGLLDNRKVVFDKILWPNNFQSSNNMILKKENYKSLTKIKIDETSKKIIFDKNITIDNLIIFPKDYEVQINEGVKIKLNNKAGLVFQNNLNINGSKNNLVFFLGDEGNYGVLILNSKKLSNIKYVIFEGLGSPLYSSNKITGGLSIYNSKVKINNSKFLNSISEDSLNIVRSEFEIKDSIFDSIGSDAIDIDFSKGLISSSTFNNVQNDAVDLSGSTVNISNLRISNINDKAISAGERTKLNAKGIYISNAFIGIASKDLSNVNATDIEIVEGIYCLTAYKKKNEYGPGFISIEKNNLSCKKLFLLENGSEINLKEEIIIPNTEGVFSFLYGN